MKKLLLPLSIFVNVAFLVIACSKMDATAPVNNAGVQSNQNMYGRGDNLAMPSPSNCNDIYNGLSYNEMMQMIDNYKNNQAVAIKNAMGFEDARSCWFSLAEIKRFVCHLESAVNANRCVSPDSLGIRFYYGAHNSEPTMAGIPASYGRHHNLIMIPTYRSNTGANVDFDPYKINLQTCTPLPLGLMAPEKKMNDVLYGSSNADGNSFSMNHGQLFPPY